MLKTAVLITFAIVVVNGCTYRDSECPDYIVLEQHADYEIRSYPALTWVMTSEESRLPRVAKFKTFRKLFNYISGQNDQGLKINMTAPVRMRSTKIDGKTTLEMSFMLPSTVSSNPPVPNDKSITISAEVPTLYAVRTFKGYVWREKTWTDEAAKLSESLRGDDAVDTTYYFQVGYDAPFEFFERRNEIWMVKQSDENFSNEV